MKKEEYRVSKFLTATFLVTPEEFNAFLEEIGDILIFPTGELTDSVAPIEKRVWAEEYKEYVEAEKKVRPMLLTYDAGDVYPFEARGGQFLIYPRYPVIQVREHQFAVTMDNRIQSMVFGKGAIRWGLIFSYPQIFYDPRDKKIKEVFKEKEAPNTVGFRKIQKWVRDFTKPAPFLIRGKKVNATFRVGKGWSQEVYTIS